MAQPALAVELAPRHPTGLALRNPVLVASGTFGRDGYGEGAMDLPQTQQLGAVFAKTTTLEARKGNPLPRIAHGPGWMLNSIGLQNPGIDAVIQEHAPRWANWETPVILSITAERLEDFSKIAAIAQNAPGISGLEVNVSCPNVVGGLDFGQSPETAAAVTASVRAATSLPVIVKLTPNVTDIVAVACAVDAAGADAITLTNTLTGMAIDVEARQPVLGSPFGGVSGPALKPIALSMVYKAYKHVSIPLIGAGGVTSAQDALEFFLAGATAVQVGSASFADPWAPGEVLYGLKNHLARKGIASFTSLVGAAQD